MNIISRKKHVVIDYIMGVVLIAAPWLLGFAGNERATWSAIAVGLLILAISLITDYEGGLIKAVPMPVHLGMDVFAGLFLAISPWLLGFHSQLYVPHLVLGVLEIGAALATDRTSQHSASGRVNVSHDFR